MDGVGLFLNSNLKTDHKQEINYIKIFRGFFKMKKMNEKSEFMMKINLVYDKKKLNPYHYGGDYKNDE